MLTWTGKETGASVILSLFQKKKKKRWLEMQRHLLLMLRNKFDNKENCPPIRDKSAWEKNPKDGLSLNT